jgi:lipopolysaccharide heptosyltransferase II
MIRQPPRRIAILKPSALGDIAHALPVLSAVRRLYPESSITWVVNKAFEPMLKGHPHLTDTLAFDRGAFRKGIGASMRYSLGFANTLRKRRFDLVLDLQGLLRTGLMCASTGAPVRIGFANAREGSKHFYTRTIDVPDADRIHAIDRYWRMVEALGGDPGPKEFVLPVDAAERAAVEAMLEPFPKPWFAVAVGAKWLTKRWPPRHFATLLNMGFREFGGTAVFLGSPEDIPLSQEAAQQLTGPHLDLTGKTSIPRLIAALDACDAMLANDTGPLHVAVALGKPAAVPYTCTKIALHGPYGQFANAVETAVPCAGSYLKNCPNGMVCMNELTPERMWPAYRKVLASMRS